jgi:predicted GNAT superfamily acetyltransferase
MNGPANGVEAANTNVVIRKCETLAEFATCVLLQGEVWGESDVDLTPTHVFVVAARTGGQVLGAFDGDKMVGFTLAFVGLHHNQHYLHSHQTCVVADQRDRGIGRALKLFQRQEALGRGIRTIEWTFDPLETRNAYFNLNRLGAISRQFLPNFYGITSSPLHRGIPTDRLLVEWRLDSARTIAAVEGLPGEIESAPASISLPSQVDHGEDGGVAETVSLQARLKKEFNEWFGRGYAAVSLHRAGENSSYLLVPWSDF